MTPIKETVKTMLTDAQAIARQAFGTVLKSSGKRTERQSPFPL
jgi:hypothetical protein